MHELTRFSTCAGLGDTVLTGEIARKIGCALRAWPVLPAVSTAAQPPHVWFNATR